MNVVQFPQLSEIDKQFLILEQQQSQIREQSRLINERGATMPNVGGKKFPYDKKGKAAAKAEAKKTGMAMKKEPESKPSSPKKPAAKKMAYGGMAMKKKPTAKKMAHGGMAMKKKMK